MNDLVSIVIPVYNGEKVIERCLGSVCRQSYKELQIICIDDGSQDHSLTLLQKIAAKDDRILVIHKENGGVSSARNEGLKRAKGKYVQFVDCDDCLEPNATQTLVDAIISSDVQLVVCGYHSPNNEIQVSYPKMILDKDALVGAFYDVYRSTYLNPPWNKLFLREKINAEFPVGISLGEDLIFNLNYISQIDKIYMLDQQLYVYSLGTEQSLTVKYNKNAIADLESKIQSIKEFLPDEAYEKHRKALGAEFLSDYTLCFHKAILSRKFSYSELIKFLTEVTASSLWKQMMCDSVERSTEDELLRCGKIGKYIRNVQRRRIIAAIRNRITNIKAK